MKKLIGLISLIVLLSSCESSKEEADLLVFNANIYTVNDAFQKAEAFAVKDGKFLEIGTSETLKEKYEFSEEIDAEGNAVYPGLIDAHAHFHGLGMQQQRVDLAGTKSFKEVVARIVEFQQKNKTDYITGRGWDQNDWEVKEFPVKDTLDELFPDTPVAITRIDGHAMLVNQAALDRANITTSTKFEGGDIEQKNGKLTGILVDNPMDIITESMDAADVATHTEALLDAQEICFGYGLTTVDDAGIDREVIELIDSLNKSGELKIRIYAMVSNTKENLDYYLDKGPYKTDRLNVRSVKFYGDGALGSRGATLKAEYSDRPGHFGALLSPVSEFKETAERISKSEFQMNTHAIGDSANF
ncbi:MAG: amidohydrolase family protein, partial [Christiangramia sp.]|nr:amidohydrolase family protein [Christiangramia sp.]